MPRILQLPTLVVNQIAAGEVIERPCSVVKELLENSLDARASRIEIDVEQGGAELIRVVDNGCGIAPEDLALALASHATSKLTSADDLFCIGTFGFRGEALASVGGVAHLTLQSRPADLPSGAQIHCQGSELSPVRPWNGSPGTRVEVRNLFFNTPVRRKFLRSASTEIGHISETCTRLALSHARTDTPGLHLVLRHNNKLVTEVPGSTDLFDRVGICFGPELQAALYPIHCDAGPLQLTGFIADPSCDRSTARMQYLFVNGRWIRDRSLCHAIQEAYRGLLMTGRYAVAFLFLTVPPDQVDVNVHPTKAEVRFRNSQALHHLIYTAVKKRLHQENLVPRLQAPVGNGEDRPMPSFSASPAQAPYVPPAAPLLPFVPPPLPEVPIIMAPVAAPVAPPTPMSSPDRRADAAPLGSSPHSRFPIPDSPFPADKKVIQLYDCYLVVETERGMLVIDQHALHERILFEQFKERIRSGTLQTQNLLIPEPIELRPEQAGRLLECREALEGLGLGVEDFGGSTVLLTRYPVLLGSRSPRQALLAVVDHLTAQDRLPAREVLFNDLLSLMACHSAVRAGERLTPEQMQALLALRDLADDTHHCPHGRPTSLLFSRQDLERQFRRA
jgi:DNA mismatch repair protein MutL